MATGSLFMAPERVIFGRGVARDVGGYARQYGAKKVFVVTDEGVAGLEGFKAVVASLEESGLDYYVYSDVDVNPSDRQIDNGGRIYKEQQGDVIVAVGGGSPIDSAKCIGILATNDGAILDFECENYVTAPDDVPVKNPIPPLICIPTTAGTGSEVGAWTVVTDTRRNCKIFVGGWMCLPKVALVDPEMSATMPPGMTAATGFDALAHAIEAYYNRFAMAQTDVFALAAIRRIARWLGPAVADGSNMEAREGMAMGALEAGLAMNAGCAGAHALGLQLTSQFGIPHGETLSITTPIILEFNAMACPDRLIDMAVALGEDVAGLGRMDAALRAAAAVRELARSVGLPTGLSRDRHEPDRLPTAAAHALENSNIYGNPRRATQGQIEDLYRRAYEEPPEFAAR